MVVVIYCYYNIFGPAPVPARLLGYSLASRAASAWYRVFCSPFQCGLCSPLNAKRLSVRSSEHPEREDHRGDRVSRRARLALCNAVHSVEWCDSRCPWRTETAPEGGACPWLKLSPEMDVDKRKSWGNILILFSKV